MLPSSVSPRRSVNPEFEPKDTERYRDVKPARLQGVDPDRIGQRRVLRPGQPTVPEKRHNGPKTSAPGTQC